MLSADMVLAAPTFQEDVAFRCGTAALCKPLDSTTLGAFRALQHAVNRVSAAVGQGEMLAIDGDIGKRTAARLRELSLVTLKRTAAEVVPGVARSELEPALTMSEPRMVAKFAQAITAYLHQAAQDVGATDPSSPSRVADYERSVMPGGQIPSAAASSPSSSGGSALPWVIGGVGVAIAIGLTTAAVVVARRRRRRR